MYIPAEFENPVWFELVSDQLVSEEQWAGHSVVLAIAIAEPGIAGQSTESEIK